MEALNAKILREILGAVAVEAPVGRGASPIRLSNVHKHVVSANLDRVAVHAYSRALHHFAGGNVVLPGVPWTGDYGAFQLTLAERAALVGAYAIDSMELTGDIGDRDGLSGDLKFIDFPGRNVVLPCRAHKSHASPLFQAPNIAR